MNEQQMKDMWIAELRSGHHKQTEGTLKLQYEDGSIGFCCLGVFREKVQGVVLDAVVKEEDRDLFEGSFEDYEDMEKVIPNYVRETSIEMNDCGSSFNDIADMIAKEWETK